MSGNTASNFDSVLGGELMAGGMPPKKTAKKPAVKKPAAKKPVAKKPAVKKPAAKKPSKKGGNCGCK